MYVVNEMIFVSEDLFLQNFKLKLDRRRFPHMDFTVNFIRNFSCKLVITNIFITLNR